MSRPRQASIIYNPLSGAHRNRDRSAEIAAFARLLDAIAAGVDCIVASGGDGTLNEVLQGMAGSDAALAIYPAGTANVLARDLGVPREPRLIAKMVAARHSRRICYGRAGSRYFFLMAGIGLDAAIIQGVPPTEKQRWGKAAYACSAAKVLLRNAEEPFEIDIDGVRSLAGFAVIGNSPSYGGGFHFTPRARLEEARFHVCWYPPRRQPLRYLGDLAAAWQAKPWSANGARYRAGSRIAARPYGGVLPWVQVDGDLLGPLPMEFEIGTQALAVIAPPAPSHGT